MLKLNLQSALPGNQQAFRLSVQTQIVTSGVTALFGPSGSGKTSLLRCIAGLDAQLTGEVIFNDEVWQDSRTFVPAHRRGIGYVFQEASLFAHLNVADNLRYASRRSRGWCAIDYKQVIGLLDLRTLVTEPVTGLSGGERQRVAIGRALLSQPRLLLMDEPLASLDRPRKTEIMPYLQHVAHDLNIPVVYVSHDIDEVMRLAEHVVVLQGGQLVTQGKLADVLNQPDTRALLQDEPGTVLELQVTDKDDEWQLIRATSGDLSLTLTDLQSTPGQLIRVRILAKDVSLSLQEQTDTSILNRLPARVAGIQTGSAAMAQVTLQIGQQALLCQLTRKSVSQLDLQVGQTVWAQIKSVAVIA